MTWLGAVLVALVLLVGVRHKRRHPVQRDVELSVWAGKSFAQRQADRRNGPTAR